MSWAVCPGWWHGQLPSLCFVGELRVEVGVWPFDEATFCRRAPMSLGTPSPVACHSSRPRTTDLRCPLVATRVGRVPAFCGASPSGEGHRWYRVCSGDVDGQENPDGHRDAGSASVTGFGIGAVGFAAVGFCAAVVIGVVMAGVVVAFGSTAGCGRSHGVLRVTSSVRSGNMPCEQRGRGPAFCGSVFGCRGATGR